MSPYIKSLLEGIDINFIYDYIDNHQYVGLFTSRMTGKTIISEYFILAYLIMNKNKTAFFTSKHQLHRERVDELLYHISEINELDISYTIKDFKKQTDSRVWYGHMNNLVHNLSHMNLDLIVIDEINQYSVRKDQIGTIRKALKRGTKLLINGVLDDNIIYTFKDWGIMDQLKIIDDNFLNNITHHSRALKINRIINNEKRDSICI